MIHTKRILIPMAIGQAVVTGITGKIVTKKGHPPTTKVWLSLKFNKGFTREYSLNDKVLSVFPVATEDANHLSSVKITEETFNQISDYVRLWSAANNEEALRPFVERDNPINHVSAMRKLVKFGNGMEATLKDWFKEHDPVTCDVDALELLLTVISPRILKPRPQLSKRYN